MAGIIIQGITPNLKIQGASQAFKFGWDTLPPPIGSFSLENAYIPTISSNSFTNFNFKNNALSGFRLLHETSNTDTIGQLKLQSFIGDSPIGTDILTFGNDGSINFISPLVISADLNMNGFKITDLATPVLPTDGVNKAYADSLVSGGTVTLIGAVTGSGSVGSNITTTLTDINISQITDYVASTTAFRLDQFAIPTANLNLNNNRITNSLDPINPQELATKAYVDLAIDNSFGSQVALPFVELDFNWANPSAQAPYRFVNKLNDAFATKTMFEEIVADDAITADRRVWRHVWGIGESVPSPSPFNNYADYALQFAPSNNSGVGQFNVYSISLNTVDGASFNFGVPVGMGGYRLKDLATPIALTDGVNKGYIDNKTWLTSQITDYTTATNSLIANATIAISKLAGYPANTTTFLRGDGTWSNQLTSDFLVNGQIKFPNAFNVNKISFYNTTGNTYDQSGIGYDGLGTSYNAPNGLSHNFFIGANLPVPLRVTQIGLLIQELKPVDSDYRRIMFLDETENLHQIYNVGIKTLDGTNHSIHSQVASYNAAFTWGHGLTTVSSYELMRLSGDALTINSAKVSITDSVNLNKWDLTAQSNGTFSFNKSTDATNNFTLTASTLSTIGSLVNTNTNANTNFTAGTSTDTVQIGYDGSVDYSYINVNGASNDRLAFRANGTGFAALLNTGLFGIGTITPTLGKIQVNGGVQNVALEETALHVRSALNSVKIELQCTAGGGKLYEVRSTNTGSFDIVDRTAAQLRYSLDTNGNHIFSNTTYGRRVSGIITMQNNATATTITTGGVFVKVAGTTTSSNLNAVLAPVSNRITSNTSIAHIAKIDCSFTAIHNGGGADEITFALYRNGVQLGNTLISTQSANNIQTLSISTLVSIPTLGDFIELWCTHPTNARTITVKHYMMTYSTT